MVGKRLDINLRILFGDDESSTPGVDFLDTPPLDAELPLFLFAEKPAAQASLLPLLSVESQSMTSLASRRAKTHEEMPEPGAIIDKYRIEKLIGVGGFATVYRATHMLLGTAVALKMLKPSVLRARPQLAAQLCAEAKLAAQIEHESVVRILDVTHNDAITYVVMEYIDGLTLADTLAASGPLAIDRALRLALDIVGGLKAGLKQRVIHRDVKPANILLTKDGRAKLVDFGLAIATSAPSDVAEATTKPNRGPAGTPGYMAPEAGEDVDHRTDIFALGVTLYQVMTGVAPVAKSLLKQQWNVLQHPAPIPLGQLRPEIDERISALIMSMMARDKTDRPATYDELALALENLLGVKVASSQAPERPA